MKVLFLGPSESPLLEFLRSTEDLVVCTADPVNLEFLRTCSPDFIVSYGYRHILGRRVVEIFRDRAVNLHISYLPWNRGADPNLWSFIEETPKGVTIHYIDEGVDTGDIIVQKLVHFSENDTLRSNYDKLQEEIRLLFMEHWNSIKSGGCDRKKQKGSGSFHRIKDKEPIFRLLQDGWDTPVKVVGKMAADNRGDSDFWKNREPSEAPGKGLISNDS